MSFSAIRDQDVAIRLLQNMVREKRIPNGLLFLGPGGVGKAMAAMELAKAINCAVGGPEPCDECLSCRKIAHGNHPDIKAVTPATKNREILKKDVDEINELAALRPFESQWRIFIIRDADRMRREAQDHFLKTLEEPPGKSVFILISEYPRILLPTIRSRCQLVRFRALRRETVADLLQKLRDLDRETAESIAGISEGEMSRALDLVDSDKRDVVLALAHRLADGDDPVVMAEEFAAFLDTRRKDIESTVKAEMGIDDANDLTRDDLERLKEQRVAQLNAVIKRDILELLHLLATWYRDAAVLGETHDREQVWNKDQLERLEREPTASIGEKIRAIEQTRVYLDRYIPEERVFRDLFLTLAKT
ncbi:MAG: DNA polymerase III subunit delta' [Candidatus Hydrogenedentales bacterium]|jgi:DNA polymerase-3 subunit delta'